MYVCIYISGMLRGILIKKRQIYIYGDCMLVPYHREPSITITVIIGTITGPSCDQLL